MSALREIPHPLGDGRITLEEFRAWRPPKEPPGKWELVNGFILFAMAEGEAHALVKMALIGELMRLLPPAAALAARCRTAFSPRWTLGTV